MTPALEVCELTAGYQGIPVVHELSFSVDPGSVLAVVGANGAGKSTTLAAIAGLLPVLGGAIRLLGRDVTGRSAAKRARGGLGFVPQDRGIVRRLTTEQNLRLLPGRLDQHLSDALRLFPDLTPLMGRRAGLLSGGEQQMLALARVLVLRPRVLMIDELSAGLAPRIVEQLLDVVTDVAHRHGTAVVLVEQHAEMALGMARAALVLSHGRLAVSGDAADVLAHPEVLESSYLGEFHDAST
jgi:branched-chain amino acid transport system ATP-binding protein